MGKYDSSRFRVVPLVDAIRKNPSEFEAFLKTVPELPDLVPPRRDSAYFYGDCEKRLKPTKEHLEGLIRYISTKEFAKTASIGQKREAICGLKGEEERNRSRDEAICRLHLVYDKADFPKAWYIFEGETNPDIYIEGEEYVIICEGKWTESHITEKTTHLKAENEFRNQMIRHIQGALNSTNKKVYAFYIVDADCGYIEDLTQEAFKQQLLKETIPVSNPDEIIASFYGYTTWQKIQCAIPNLKFLSKDEIDSLK